MEILLYIVGGYILVNWVGLRLIVPHLGFRKSKLPKEIPVELQDKIAQLNSSAKDDSEFLKLAYDYITTKYTGGHAETITMFWRAFGDTFGKSPGFLPCNAQNYILRTMLVRSGRFKDSDVQVKVALFTKFIHQYLLVKVGDTFIVVDPWANFMGIPLGKTVSLFHKPI